ncbi:MAG: DCC1-like thiol-disulfide oxidoreductase family protein [Verrucomicrobia bacterium]|nr:DCC1-like thiol-disulfide oxidoreductase family protein [Verrucomicrobiota bacterium]
MQVSVNTEISDTKNGSCQLVWVFYDGECRPCTRFAGFARRFLDPSCFAFESLTTPWVVERLHGSPAESRLEMAVLTKEGTYIGGPDAVRIILAEMPAGRALAWGSRLPGIRCALNAGYRAFARHRHCFNGACEHSGTSLFTRALAAALWSFPVLCASVLALNASAFAPWANMWLLALSVFLICKGLTSVRALSAAQGLSTKRLLCYWLAWPGMDARAFFDHSQSVMPDARSSYLWASALTSLGVGLIWSVARLTWPTFPVLTAWLGMVGTILFLHFGLFNLLACFWQTRGVNAEAIMRAPIMATSISEFWGRRWNRAFNRMAQTLIYIPSRHRLGVKGAAFFVFLVSGLIHDLVISVPAGGGYGQPTIYFGVQFFALMIERSRVGKRLGLAAGWRGWLFTMMALMVPVPLLFHSAFIYNVMLPFLVAIHAIQGVQL